MTADPPDPRAELALAFAPPEMRAAATAPAGLADRLSLRDHVVAVEIGAFESERGLTQRIRFDVVVEIAAPAGPLEDDVDRILSYDRIAEAIAAEIAQGRVNLLETLAEGVAARLMAEPRVARVFLRIQKLDRGPGDLGVEIVRSPAPRPAQVSEPPRPVVAILGEAAIAAPDLPARLAALGGPLLIVASWPPGMRPEAAGSAMAQRRIDLLALDQNAWRVQARLPGAGVAATRTEIDWALRRGRPVVWAPARLVLDSVPPPGDGPWELALWLAAEWRAARVVVLGEGIAGAAPEPLPGGVAPEWLPL